MSESVGQFAGKMAFGSLPSRAAHQLTLSKQAFITVVDPEGSWQVKDGTTIYHVYRSGDGLQVYAVPA